MLGDKLKPGSVFLFSLIRILLVVFGATGAALIATGIWFWTEVNEFSWPEIIFIAFGVF